MSGARLPAGAIANLRGLRPDAAATDTQARERCDLCGREVAAEHRHLLALTERRILCACEVCGAVAPGEGDLKAVGTRTLWLDDLDLPDVLWAAFQIPIGLAFFFRSSTTGAIVGLYPSPAGATECELHFASWNALVAANPVLATLEPDAEALIVDRLTAKHGYALVPIDQCYRLVGMIKAAWEGISGGDAVRNAVPGFMAETRAKALAARR